MITTLTPLFQWLQQPDQLDQEDLHRQCRDLRVKIEQEHDGYKHKLKAMQEGAQKQTTLATKLQNKVTKNYNHHLIFLNFILPYLFPAWVNARRAFTQDDVFSTCA